MLQRTSNWLSAMDAAGFIEISPPHPDDPDARPRARIDWLEALAATGYGGALACRSLQVHLDPEDDPYGVETGVGDRSRRADAAGEPWRQEHLALHPAAEEEAAIARAAHANPYPVAQLPLNEHLRRALGALRPGRRMTPRLTRRSRRQDGGANSISRTMHQHTRAEVEDWLGFALPSLTPLEKAGRRLLCLTSRMFWTSDADPLPARGSSLPNGEPMELEIYLLWAPAEADLTRVALHDAEEEGWVVGSVGYSPFTRAPQEERGRRATSLTEPAGAYTGITVNGSRLGVQHSLPGHTRIGWTRRGPAAPTEPGGGVWYRMALHVPREPVAAVELILASRDIP
ncbi:hypothetical protein [Kineococcus xinjiangensis]|uniref:hypothetical protein n=1 Tax=Kineococcus xinjiangensis TaxID=512762 RepID=UPI001FE44660|nr:hypothetical protein [Kineococcus xinjiangensis]